MLRGFLNSLSAHDVYTSQPKDWYVELTQSTYFWFDLIINPPEGLDYLQSVRTYLKDLKQTVKSEWDKHFIYFLGARPKIRFRTQYKPHYTFFSKNLVIEIEIGAQKIRRRCIITLRDATGKKKVTPCVDITDRLITLYDNPFEKVSYSIYDFFSICGIRTGMDTEIHYVGYTHDPSTRVIDRNHRGFGDMVHTTSRTGEAYDYFVFFNLFKVTSVSNDTSSPLHFIVSNAIIDEISNKKEGLILEKGLIKYFNPTTQRINKNREMTELHNLLMWLKTQHNIHAIYLLMEIEDRSDLFRFFSSSMPASNKHHFRCEIGKQGVEIIPVEEDHYPPNTFYDTRPMD